MTFLSSLLLPFELLPAGTARLIGTSTLVRWTRNQRARHRRPDGCSTPPAAATATPSAASWNPIAPSSSPTATGCWARSTTPKLLRAWRGLHRFEHARPLRPWLYKIATNVCLDAIGKRPKRVLPIDRGPPVDARTGSRQAVRGERLARAVPGRAARRRGRLCGARGSLRAARERRAGLRRSDAASAGASARGSRPARRTGLLRTRGCPRLSRRRRPR
jgi:Sigma-70 region 2